MSAKNIIDYPITSSVFLTVFYSHKHYTFSLSKTGSIVYNSKYLATEFSVKSYKNHELLGYIGKPTFEKKAAKFLESIDYDYSGTATDAIIDYLRSQDYPFVDDCQIWVIVPKPHKKPTGDKFTITFEWLPTEDFNRHKHQNLDLDVYMTKINSDTKKVLFRVDIPDYIYNKCMENPDIENRLELKYIESENLSELHSKMGEYGNMAERVDELLKASETYKKKIGIVFRTGETSERDSFNFSYLGQKINVTFSWYIAYEYEKSGIDRKVKAYFTWKKNMGSGTHIGEYRGYTGIVDFEKKGIKSHIHTTPPGVLIDWTQEREDFLVSLEEKFRNLSSNLNEFLSDLDNEKLDKLISSASANKLLNS